MPPSPNLALLVGITLLTACGGAYSSAPSSNTTALPPPAPGTPNSVVVTNNAFAPELLTTSAGATVTWTWDSCRGGDGYGVGQICTAHDVTFDDGSASGTQSSGTFTRTFAAAGTYPYHCRVHGTAMSGSIVVK